MQCHIVKNTLLQTAFSAHWLTLLQSTKFKNTADTTHRTAFANKKIITYFHLLSFSLKAHK